MFGYSIFQEITDRSHLITGYYSKILFYKFLQTCLLYHGYYHISINIFFAFLLYRALNHRLYIYSGEFTTI